MDKKTEFPKSINGFTKKSKIKKTRAAMAEVYLDNLLASSPENFYWIDTEGRVLGCNDNQARFFGLKRAEDLIGKTIYDVAAMLGWDKSIPESVRKNDLEVMATQCLKRVEEVAVINGEKRIYLSIKNPMLNKKKAVIGVFGITVDITEQKRLEENLREAKARAEIANKAKSEFLAVMSHELRIPLTGILGMAYLMQASEKCADNSHYEAVNEIVKSGEHLLAVINDLLDFSKLEAGRLDLQMAPFDFRVTIEESVAALNYQAKLKGLELLIDYPVAVPSQVIGDVRAVKQIVLNLLNNAIKFTQEGHVLIRVDKLGDADNQVILDLRVEDTGIGIAPDKHAMIFEKFSQADASYARKQGGIGLGLAITRHYLEAMGGSISVESKPGAGSVFSCMIPFTLAQQTFISPWEKYQSCVRILIVYDDLYGQVLMRHIGSPLCQVVKGADALNTLRAAQLRGEPFDIIVVDEFGCGRSYLNLRTYVMNPT